jgi:hypothetical protein
VGAFYDSDNNIVWSTEIFAGHLDVEVDSDEESGDGESVSASSEVGLSDSEDTDSASGTSCFLYMGCRPFTPRIGRYKPPVPPSSSPFLMAVQTSTPPAQKTISTLASLIDTETKLLLPPKFAKSTLTGTRVRHTSSPLSIPTPRPTLPSPRPTLPPPRPGTRRVKGQYLDTGKPRSIQRFAVGFTPGSPCVDDLLLLLLPQPTSSPCPAAGTPFLDAMRLVLVLPLLPLALPCRRRGSHTSLTTGDLRLNTTVT